MLSGLNEIFEQEGFYELEEPPEEIHFWMEDHFGGRSKTFPITLADIENPQIQAKPVIPIQSTGHSQFSGVNHQDNPENQENLKTNKYNNFRKPNIIKLHKMQESFNRELLFGDLQAKDLILNDGY